MSGKKQNHKKFKEVMASSIVYFNTFVRQDITHFLVTYNNCMAQLINIQDNELTLIKNLRLHSPCVSSFYFDQKNERLYIGTENGRLQWIDWNYLLQKEEPECQITPITLKGDKIWHLFKIQFQYHTLICGIGEKSLSFYNLDCTLVKRIKFTKQILACSLMFLNQSVNLQSKHPDLICCLAVAGLISPILLSRLNFIQFLSLPQSECEELIQEILKLSQEQLDEQQQLIMESQLVTCISAYSDKICIGTESGKLCLYKIRYLKQIDHCVVQLGTIVKETSAIQSIDLDAISSSLVISSKEKITFVDEKNKKKLANGLNQKSDKNLNLVRWTSCGKVVMIEAGSKKSSIYIYSNEFPI